MNRPTSESLDRVLIVEGQDDKHVVGHFWRRWIDMDATFEISDKGSVEQALRAIRLEIMSPGRQVVGILVDADDSLSERWTAVRDRLRSVEVHAPASPDPAGTIIDATDDTPRVGIWLMPDNISTGEIEDFAVRMIPSEDRVWPKSEAYIDSIPPRDRKFSPGKTQRAKLHAWLATREDPRQMGLAIRTRDLVINGDLCARFGAWIKKLFDYSPVTP